MSLTRRAFLAGGLAAAAGGLGACRDRDRDRDGERFAAPALRDGYDLCVIGSGFAGLPLALRAAAKGLETIVIEAGGEPGQSTAEGQRSFRFAGAEAIEYPLAASRMIAIGGSSNHWAGTVNRLRPSDFRARSAFDQDVDWPLSYADLEPHYCRAESDLSVWGFPPVAGAEPRRSCAYPLEGRALEERGPYREPRLRVGERELHYFPLARSEREGGPVRLLDREAVAFARARHGSLLARHRVARLVTLDGRTIDHALVHGDGGETSRVRAAVFVLAAGVVESARLLLLSRSRWFPRGLGNERDLVGRHFVEHPTFRWEFHPAAGDYVLSGLVPGEAYTGENRSYDYSDGFRRRGLGAAHFQLRVFRERSIILKLQPEIEPRPENRVALSETQRDSDGDPLADLRFGFSERDLRTFEEGRAVLVEQTRALGGDPEAAERDMKWRFHPAGTLRMARDEASGVVDPEQRVFGIENLYVSGASLFPTSGTANPTLTVVALAHRLADALLQERP